ncbi:hypothetical protein J26TS2_09910 [Shouchella clausii]|nr:hypothetical protein J26TS2_09910 [Shouchella clausii]
MKVGFIGLGIMGKPMSKNLLIAGYKLVVIGRNPAVTEEFIDLGATVVTTPREVVEGSDVVITMLPNSPEVKEVVLGGNGLFAGASEGKVLIDMSSIAPLVSREVASKLKEKSMEMLMHQ